MTIQFVYSCRKDKNPIFDGVNCSANCFILSGKLVDSAANAGISSGEIKFYFNDNIGTFSNKKIYLGRAITDANGDYTFKFDGSRFKDARGYYYAEAYKGNLFHDPVYENRVSVFYLDTTLYNVPFIQNFLLFRPATLKLRVMASTITNFQYLTVSYSYGSTGYGVVFNGGRQIDTTLIFKTAGDIKTFVQSDARGNNVNITKHDTLVIQSGNTRQLEIRF